MKKSIIILTLLLSIFLSSCNDWNGWEIIKSEDKLEQSQKLEKPVIYTSFYPIYFLTKSLVWDKAEVINLVPAWWEPHDFEPTLKQVGEMWKSKMIILNWLWMEAYEEKLLESIKNVPIIMISEQLKNPIKLVKNKKEKITDSHEHGNIDPHTWLSPKEYREMWDILVAELEKNWFTNLDKSILQKITDMDAKYNKDLAKCKMIQMVTFHEAFWYIARDYWFRQKWVYWISPDQEPSAKDMTSLIRLVKNQKLKYIFSEKFVSTKYADTIRDEAWVTVLYLHPLETLSSEDTNKKQDLLSIMDANLWFLKTWLECSNK